MSIRAYLCSQDARLRALGDEHGDDVVLLAVVEYRRMCVGNSARGTAESIFGDGDEIDRLEGEVAKAERNQDDAEEDARKARDRVLELEKENDALRARVSA